MWEGRKQLSKLNPTISSIFKLAQTETQVFDQGLLPPAPPQFSHNLIITRLKLTDKRNTNLNIRINIH